MTIEHVLRIFLDPTTSLFSMFMWAFEHFKYLINYTKFITDDLLLPLLPSNQMEITKK